MDLPQRIKAYVHNTKILLTAQKDSCQFSFKEEKWLASFSGTQITGNLGKRGIVKILLAIGCQGYIYTKVYISRKKYTHHTKNKTKKLILRTRKKFNHVLGRFWGRGLKFDLGVIHELRRQHSGRSLFF